MRSGYRFGSAPAVAIEAGDGEIEAALGEVFARFRVPLGPATPTLPLSVERTVGERVRLWLGPHPLGDTRAEALAPALEAALVGLAARSRPDQLPFHAASVTKAGEVLWLAGDKASGKSTLALALVDAGYTYLGDELAFLTVDGAGSVGFPKAVTLKEGSFARAPEARTWLDPIRGPVRYVLPGPAVDPVAGRPSRVVWIRHGDVRARRTLEPDEAAIRLVRQAFGGLERHPSTLAAIGRLAERSRTEIAYRTSAEALELLETAA